MALYRTKRGFLQRPSNPPNEAQIEIDWSHPFNAGLVFRHVGLRDLVSKNYGEPYAAYSATQSSQHYGINGQALESHSNGDGGFVFRAPRVAEFGGQPFCTVGLFSEMDSAAGYGRLISIKGVAADTGFMRFDTNTNLFFVGDTSGGAMQALSSAGAVNLDGLLHHVVGVKDDTTTTRYYLDGVAHSTSVDGGNDNTFNTFGDTRVTVLGRPDDGSFGVNGREYQGAYWARALNAGEIRAWKENPWLGLRPRVPTLYYTAAAGGTQTDKTINFGMVTGMVTTTSALRPKAISFGMTTAMVSSSATTIVKSVNVALPVAMALTKTTKRTRTVGFPFTTSLARQTGVTKAVSFVTSMGTTTATVFTKAISAAFVTTMVLAKESVLGKSIAVGFTTAMALTKTTKRTVAVGFATGYTLARQTRVVKAVSFVTSMVTSKALTLTQAFSFSHVTSMALSTVRVTTKAISVTFVTAMNTVTDFTAGSGVFGRITWLFRRRRR